MVPRSQVGIEDYVVTPSTILVPRSGQLSGILGRAVLPYGAVVGGAVTEDAIRINCADEETAGFLFVALSSPYGVRQLKARAYGSSIPHLDVNGIRAVLVPDVASDARLKIGREGARTALLRGKAIDLEGEAVALVESAIEEAA
jgi:type I restriction enzyme S subunit